MVTIKRDLNPDWLSFALMLGDDAERIIRAGLRERKVSIKADGTPVTDADIEVNRHVIAAVAGRWPGHQVVGEEQSTADLDLDKPTWVVDPIDGTLLYAAGVGVGCFSLAFVVGGVVQVALVVDPWTNSTWWATIESPTVRNGEPVRVSETAALARSKCAVECADVMTLAPALSKAGAKTVSLWASVRSGAAVVDGGLDAMCYGPGHPWDVSALSLLVGQAGGVAGPIDGSLFHGAGPVGRFVIAATKPLFDEVADVWFGLLNGDGSV